MEYIPITADAAERLRREIFGKIAHDIYARERPLAERRFNLVRTIFSSLICDEGMSEVREAIKTSAAALLGCKHQLWNAQTREYLYARIESTAEAGGLHEHVTDGITDLKRFVSLAMAGREYYHDHRYDPDTFIGRDVVFLAALCDSRQDVLRKLIA